MSANMCPTCDDRGRPKSGRCFCRAAGEMCLGDEGCAVVCPDCAPKPDARVTGTSRPESPESEAQWVEECQLALANLREAEMYLGRDMPCSALEHVRAALAALEGK